MMEKEKMVTKSRKTISDRMLDICGIKTFLKKMEEQNTPIWWLNDESEQMLNRGYLLKGETVEGAIDRITTAAVKDYTNQINPAFKENDYQRLDFFFRLQFGRIWELSVVCRISCFNVHVPDYIEGITHKLGEVIIQTKIGGIGTSGYFGELQKENRRYG